MIRRGDRVSVAECDHENDVVEPGEYKRCPERISSQGAPSSFLAVLVANGWSTEKPIVRDDETKVRCPFHTAKIRSRMTGESVHTRVKK